VPVAEANARRESAVGGDLAKEVFV